MIEIGQGRPSIEIGLSAAIVAIDGDKPAILVVERPGTVPALPSGPFDPLTHRTLEIGLRGWVEAQTALKIGYVEQLYTFGDRGRHARFADRSPHEVSVGYLALTRIPAGSARGVGTDAAFTPWYDFFPWEDWRGDRPAMLDELILPELRAWADEAPTSHDASRGLDRRERLRLCFGEDGMPWDEERALERYELLYDAGMVEEAARDGRERGLRRHRSGTAPALGRTMQHDHRRILATAISRLRAKLKYRPVVFELMAETFTLTELQRTMEAAAGRHVHKQNFRRLVENSALVEPTGGTTLRTGGRPAQLFRFRRDVLKERPAPGLRLGGRG
ncbi:MAG: NAD regulator [Ancalomicrobiaceae bacterium]|nr:NAD regulator [Ancalomicrobiaceae bacterium]